LWLKWSIGLQKSNQTNSTPSVNLGLGKGNRPKYMYARILHDNCLKSFFGVWGLGTCHHICRLAVSYARASVRSLSSCTVSWARCAGAPSCCKVHRRGSNNLLFVILVSNYLARKYWFVIGHVCSIVRQLVTVVRSFVNIEGSGFSRGNSPSVFHEIWQGCSASAPNVTINFREDKVKVQGQNRSTENIPVTVARLWYKISSPNLAIRLKYFRHAFGQNSRWRPDWGCGVIVTCSFSPDHCNAGCNKFYARTSLQVSTHLIRVVRNLFFFWGGALFGGIRGPWMVAAGLSLPSTVLGRK